MGCDVLIPMKEIGRCKSRLAFTLPPSLRRALVLSMLKNVLEALMTAEGVRDVTVVGGGSALRAFATACGACWMPEWGRTLNTTLQEALQRVVSAGPQAVGIVLGDLPFLKREEVEAALHLLEKQYDCVLASDEAGTGTNGAFIRTACAFQPRFGGGSLGRHRRELSKQGYRVSTFRTYGFSHDVDTARDVLTAWPRLRD